jgi:hypothetical protein
MSACWVIWPPQLPLTAVLHDLVLTAGIYSLIGFEVTPATVIGLLAILGFSLYDTVVVFLVTHPLVALASSSRVFGSPSLSGLGSVAKIGAERRAAVPMTKGSA